MKNIWVEMIKMKIVVDINTPGQVHSFNFKNFVGRMKLGRGMII